jgi:DNA-binding transcriptional LysR family regulator
MDHISRIGIFLEVVKHKSFAGAARSIGISGPAVSKQVQALEDQLGVKLLHRTTRQVTLTEQGAIYNERARKALEDLDEAENHIKDLKQSPTGLLRINAPMSFGREYLSPSIATFAKTYPDVSMDVDYDDRHIDVIGEGYDVVIRIGALDDSSLIARKIATCPIVLCASPAFIAQHGVPQVPADISSLPAILYTKNGLYEQWSCVDSKGNPHTVKLSRHLAANNSGMMLEACRQGIGLAVLPIFTAIKHINSGDLVHLLPEHTTTPARNIYAMFPENRYLSTKVRLFIDHMTDFGKTLPW